LPTGEELHYRFDCIDISVFLLYETPFNYKRDSRKMIDQDIYEPKGMDACQTPPYAVDPLLPYLHSKHMALN